MVTYPVRVPRNPYRGNDAKKRAKAYEDNQYAALIEATANRLIQAQKRAVQSYLWMEISRESQIDYEVVKRLGFSIDGGSNGFTAIRPGLSQEDYQRAMNGEDV